MSPSLDSLKTALGLRPGDLLEERRPPGEEVSPGAMLPWLAPRRVHEFADTSDRGGDWQPPLTLLAGLVGDMPFEGSVAWVGRRCWPTFQYFLREGRDVGRSLGRHLFLDPLSDADRLWGLLETARSAAVRAVVADGSGMGTTAGRRLQLAAEKGGAVVLLARPAADFSRPSWAATRWRVSPLASASGRPRWRVALARAAGARQGQDASRHWIVTWTYEVFRGTGVVDLSADVGRGPRASPAPASAS
jgi:hypothetical protein